MNSPKREITESEKRLHEKLRRDLGENFMQALSDPKTVEIMLNEDGILWQERLGEGMFKIGTMSPTRAEAVMRVIASCLGTEVSRDDSILEGELPLDGSRFAGSVPPTSSAPAFAVRKKASAIFKLSQYVEQGIMSERQKEAIQQAVSDHKNILVIGGTGSGKTTLCNSIIDEVSAQFPNERIIIIEDTGEIQCSAENTRKLLTSLGTDMSQLLKHTLRLRPDRILIGEVRGAEALDLLDSWNTGHEGGIATLHANNAAAGLDRLRSLVTRNPLAPADIEPLIGEVVHMIVHIAKCPEGRRIEEILQVSGYSNGSYNLQKLT